VKTVQARLIDLFSSELKLDPAKLDIETPFQDYGVDSILLAQLLRQINLLVKNDLDPSTLFEYANIESLSKRLALTHASALSETLGTGVSPQSGLPPPDSQPSPSLTSGALPERVPLPGPVHPGDIAVIGYSCRFPGARTPGEYWQLLSAGRSAIQPVPRERWGYANPFHAGLLDNINHFDAKFFLVPEEDARAMDPQALVVLEESLNLFYRAGYSHREIKGKPIGVFLGGRGQYQADEPALRQARNLSVAVGQNYLAANISHFFDLRGPALVLDTACSSALVAMYTAIQALHSGEIQAALVGGVNLLSSDGAFRLFQQRGILSPGPSFHIFDKRANGLVLGEGAGMVLLKTVDRALADKDCIYAVIKALAINNDGRTAGPAAPNLQGQKEVMQTALTKSGMKPEEISYIEVNGSGAEVTDLLELKAIRSVYRSASMAPCGLGSMKPNIGHSLCAEGIAAFIKVVLMLRHRQWVPFLSGNQPMTHFDMQSSPFYFCRALQEWTFTPRAAAINCFADGGTNAHVLLAQWTGSAPGPTHRHPLPPPALNPRPVHPNDLKPAPAELSSRDSQGKKAGLERMIWETFQ
jgi:acyl transferase domain-containing protein/acyl carrier protein